MKCGPTSTGVALESVREEDAEFTLRLRTDPDLARHVSPTSPDLARQREWIRSYLLRQEAGSEYYFIIRKQSEAVGTVRLYDFRECSFCWGSWLIVRGTDLRVAPASAMLAYDFGFNELGFSQSHFDVRRANGSVRRFHLSMGAKIVRSDTLDDFYEISRESYLEHRPKLMRLAGIQG